jgi:hypothetical protein
VHLKAQTTERAGAERARAISYRNAFLFVGKNITDSRMRAEHWLHLPGHLAAAAAHGRWALWRGWWDAVRCRSAAKAARNRLGPAVISDRDLFRRFGEPSPWEG